MKKILAMLLLVCMVFAIAACGQQTAPAEKPAEQPADKPADQPVEQPVEQPTEQAPEAPAAAEAEYKLGMGVSLNTNSSKEGNAQVDATVAAVVLDADGKIVAAKIDVAQDKMDVTDGQVDTEKTFLTKKELKEDYGMSKIGAVEWYLQAAEYEKFLIGKTAAEIEAVELVEDGAHIVFADETLHASCSISVSEFQAAVLKACSDEQGMTFKTADEFKLGLAAISKADESVAATADEEGVVKMYTEFGAAVVGADGKILAALTDATQPQIKINAAGEIGETTFKGTKRELKEDYNMVKFSGCTYEWYQQAAAFAEYAVGKTAAELKGSELKLNDEGHMVFVDETLYASVSISVDGMINVVAQAAEYAD